MIHCRSRRHNEKSVACVPVLWATFQRKWQFENAACILGDIEIASCIARNSFLLDSRKVRLRKNRAVAFTLQQTIVPVADHVQILICIVKI